MTEIDIFRGITSSLAGFRVLIMFQDRLERHGPCKSGTSRPALGREIYNVAY
jgi:hypothetical protein